MYEDPTAFVGLIDQRGAGTLVVGDRLPTSLS
jgi:hypothetical protein